MDVQITVPDAADAEQLAQVHVQGWREAYGDMLPERFYDEAALAGRRRMWQRLLGDEASAARVRVARHEGRVVGFILSDQAPEDPQHPPIRSEELFALYVTAQWYGTGVGDALLTERLADRPAQLWVARDNARARRFYEKHGFVHDGTEKVDTDLDGLVEVRMVR